MKKSTLLLIVFAVLFSFALPLHAQDGCVDSPRIQLRSLRLSAPQERSLSPRAHASRLAAGLRSKPRNDLSVHSGELNSVTYALTPSYWF